MCPQNSFSRFSRKKSLNKRHIKHLICDKKAYIHFWCKMTPSWSHSDSLAMVQTRQRLKRTNPYFYIPKSPSSDTLPAPEIFFSNSGDVFGVGHGLFLTSLILSLAGFPITSTYCDNIPFFFRSPNSSSSPPPSK